MAEYIIPEFFRDSITGEPALLTYKRLRTYGRRPADRMLPDERVTRKRLSKSNWDQLNAVSKGRYVNHIGRGHNRDLPHVSERAWEDRLTRQEQACLACAYGNTAVYLHNH